MSRDKNERLIACLEHGAYLFDLTMVCGGYAYHSAFTVFEKFMENHRERRRPDLVLPMPFRESFAVLDIPFTMICERPHYEFWLRRKGWALVARDFARNEIPQWLKGRTCIADNHDTYTDIALAHPSALSREVNKPRRKRVHKRDAERCIICEAQLPTSEATMHHVRAFSLGGETTARNLVACCDACNQALGMKPGLPAVLHLGKKVSDVSLIPFPLKSGREASVEKALSQLCHNRMFTRCSIE